jgi:hypothetical protein
LNTFGHVAAFGKLRPSLTCFWTFWRIEQRPEARPILRECLVNVVAPYGFVFDRVKEERSTGGARSCCWGAAGSAEFCTADGGRDGILQFTLEHHAYVVFSFIFMCIPSVAQTILFRGVSEKPNLRSPRCGADDRRLHLVISACFRPPRDLQTP